MWGLGEPTRQRLIPLLEREIGSCFDDFDVRRAAPELTALRVRLLAVHDVSDTQIRSAEAESIVAVWPGAELMLTEGLGHHEVLRDPAVVRRVAAFAASIGAG
jgi:hypothetical protein